MSAPLALSATQARRLAVAAAGLARPRSRGRLDARHIHRVVGDIGLLQLDSVNVVARAHELVLFSRLGPGLGLGLESRPAGLLDRVAYRDRALFEYWGHEASLLPVELQPLLRWRMQRAEERMETWGGPARTARDRPELVAAVLAELDARGPLRASELESVGEAGHARPGEGVWWDRSAAKNALEWLFWIGRVGAADRVGGWQRRYDVVERIIPARILAAPTPTEEAAHRALLERAAGHLGVGTAADLADYYRIHGPTARERITELVADGVLVPVEVEGWREPGYLHRDTAPRRGGRGTALLAPFDPLVWRRERAERIFDFRYRIEIYVPERERVHGYYVLPFLREGELVARVDVKTVRASGVLRVRGAFAERGEDTGDVADALTDELTLLAGWQGCDRVEVAPRGNLAAALAAALRRRAPG